MLLILSKNDVEQSVTMAEVINVMEEAFITYASRDFIMPDRTFIKVKDDDTMLIMTSVVGDSVGTKIVASYPSNRDTGESVTQGFITVNDRYNGKALSLMDGTLLTAIKTAGVSGVAMRRLKPNAKSVGLVGTGLQGLYQLVAAIETTTVDKIYVYNRSQEKVPHFIEEFREISGSHIEVEITENTENLVEQSDIIITATTSNTPVLPNKDYIYNGKLVVGVGSFNQHMRELPERLFTNTSYYFIDSAQGKKECGDIIDPIENDWINEDNVILLSDLLTGQFTKNTDEQKPIIFKNVSMALFDTVIGEYVYKKCRQFNLGMDVQL